MATYQHIRSSTAHKRPTTSIADGQLAINTNTASPGLFFKDSAGTGIVKVGPVHVGTTAPNSSPAVGGSSGNYLGEQWLDTSVSPAQMKVWNGSAWVGIVADELPVSKLQDGAARQLIQTDAAGTGVEWTSNIDVPGTLDVTSTATFDSIAQHPLGTAGAPTITFTGDNNTGIYSPGADQLALSTNGTGRLFVDASGNVLINDSASVTSNVSAYLRIRQSNAAADTSIGIINAQNSDANATVKIKAGQVTRNGGEIVFGRENGQDWSTTTSADGYIAFSPVLNNTNTERLRITSTGLVGIGTSAPGVVLDIRETATGATTAISLFNTDNTNSTSQTARIGLSPDSRGAALTGLEVYKENADFSTSAARDVSLAFNVLLNNAKSEAVRITSAGLVGIGTSTPSYLIDASNSSAPTLRLTDSIRHLLVRGGSTTQNPGIGTDYAGDLSFFTNGAANERARIDSSGRLLVGTSTARANFYNTSGPSAAFQVEGNDNNTAAISIVANTNANANAPQLIFGKSAGTAVGSNTLVASGVNLGRIAFQGNDGTEFVQAGEIRCDVDGTPGANDMPGRIVLSTTADGASIPTERLRIDSSGRLLVGTSGADTTYRVGATGYTPKVEFKGTDVYQLALNRTNDSCYLAIASKQAASSGVNVGGVTFNQWDGTNLLNAASIVAAVDGTPGANDMPGRLVFSTTADGASSPTERLRITSAGLVGVGTASPLRLWHVLDSANSIVGRVESGQSSSWLQFAASGNGTASRIGSPDGASTASLAFMTNDQERARIDSSGRLLIGTSSASGGALLQVNGDRIRVATAKTPASATDTGTAGEICWDANYIYVCTATNTWKRTAIATW